MHSHLCGRGLDAPMGDQGPVAPGAGIEGALLCLLVNLHQEGLMMLFFILVGRDVDPWREDMGSPSRLSLGGRWGAEMGKSMVWGDPGGALTQNPLELRCGRHFWRAGPPGHVGSLRVASVLFPEGPWPGSYRSPRSRSLPGPQISCLR